MKKARIVFYGTPAFAVGSLKALLEADKEVIAVITAPDKPAGRGRTLRPSAVKEFATSKNIPVLQPTNLKDPTFLDALQQIAPDLQVVVAFRMLPEAVWKLPPLGTFNLHASLLPQYRGAAPINWALIHGEATTGVSTFFIDEHIDTGAIILQEKVEISPTDNAGSLHDKLMHKGSQLVVETVTQIESGNYSTQIQQSSEKLKPAPKLHAENTKINWDNSATAIANKIRGLSPFPSAWCYFQNGPERFTVKIYKATAQKERHSHQPGKVLVSKKELRVACLDGYICIEELQLPGKKKMATAALLNGYSIATDSSMF